jgi:hypothetical protein
MFVLANLEKHSGPSKAAAGEATRTAANADSICQARGDMLTAQICRFI